MIIFDLDNIDSDDDIIDDDDNKVQNNLYNDNEIEINYNSINLYINDEKVVFSINNYIALYDLLTNEKHIIGRINKITNLYILVNDTKIYIK